MGLSCIKASCVIRLFSFDRMLATLHRQVMLIQLTSTFISNVCRGPYMSIYFSIANISFVYQFRFGPHKVLSSQRLALGKTGEH